AVSFVAPRHQVSRPDFRSILNKTTHCSTNNLTRHEVVSRTTGVADDTAKTDLLAALTEFAGRADLTAEAREQLEILLAKMVDGCEIAPTKALALTPAALA